MQCNCEVVQLEQSGTLYNQLDLDRKVERQRHADGAAGVASGLAEHRDQQVAATVDHAGRIFEVGGNIDHAENFDALAHIVE